jgi:hypothetical protein
LLNAYEEGLGNAWQPIQRYWREPTLAHRNAVRAGLNFEGMRHEYSAGIPDPSLIKPESYTLDAALLEQITKSIRRHPQRHAEELAAGHQVRRRAEIMSGRASAKGLGVKKMEEYFALRNALRLV